jgi:hypothetical protein
MNSSQRVMVGDVAAWLETAKAKATLADEKAALTAAAQERMRVTALELETLRGEVRAAHDRWLRYDESLPSAKPDALIVAQDNLRAVIAECEPLARVAEMAALTASVARAVVDALVDLQPIRRSEAWLLANAPAEEEGIRADIASLQARFSRLAAMETAAEPSEDQRMRMHEIGVSVRDRRLRDQTIELPPLITQGATRLHIAADPCEVTKYRIAVEQAGGNAPQPAADAGPGLLALSGPAALSARVARLWRGN